MYKEGPTSQNTFDYVNCRWFPSQPQSRKKTPALQPGMQAGDTLGLGSLVLRLVGVLAVGRGRTRWRPAAPSLATRDCLLTCSGVQAA